MKNLYITGNTAFNDGLNLPSGMLSIDTEKNAVRFYDGQTVGGYEIIGERAVASLGPGPIDLVAGDMTAGFFGEVTGGDVFTYEALALQIGLSVGNSQFNAESIWLKFALDGNIVYVAKKPARSAVSWADINAVNAVYSGGAQATVGNAVFDVTLLKGAATDPTNNVIAYDVPETYGSEWNRLLYPVHSGAHTDPSNPATHTDPNTAPFGSWANYSDGDLLVHRDLGNGSFNWCQEAHPGTTNGRVWRGVYGVTHINRGGSTSAGLTTGWRPVLRLR